MALTLAIGATTAMFSIVNAELLRPLPVKDPDRIVEIFQGPNRSSKNRVSMADYLDWKQRLHSFDNIALYRPYVANLSDAGGPHLVDTLECDSSFLPLLGVPLALGRNFSAEDDIPGHDQEAILSRPFWQNRFGGRSVLGRKILLGGRPYLIVGVMAKGIPIPEKVDLAVPIPYNLNLLENTRGYRQYQVLGRLRPGVSLAAANSELLQISQAIAAQYQGQEKGIIAHAVPFHEEISGGIRAPLLILFWAVVSVMLIACVNVAHLLLVKASLRTRELSIRFALGATRVRILSQLFTESLLLSTVSAAAGLGVAALAVRAARTLDHTPLPDAAQLSLDWRVLVFAIGVAATTGIFFGCFPGLQAHRADVNEALKQSSGRITESRPQKRLRKIFVFGESALATVLLICSVLFLRSLVKLTEVDPGFQTGNLLTMYVSLPGARFEDSQKIGRMADQILQGVRALQGVKDAAFAQFVPLLTPTGGFPVIIQGEPLPVAKWSTPPVTPTPATVDYFRTAGIRLISGRPFEPRDSSPEAAIAIINQKLASTFFAGKDPIGRYIAFAVDTPAWKQIVGVVADMHQTGLENPIVPQLYVPLAHMPLPHLAVIPLALLVRTEGEPLAYANAIEREVHRLDPDLPVAYVRTIKQVERQELKWRTVQTSLLTLFGGLALLLAFLGIYAVIAYSISQRTAEIGIRMTVGATDLDILKMMLLEGAAPAIAGTLVGVVLALLSGRLITSLLFGTKPTDCPTYVLVVAAQVVIALAAAYFPARRAASLHPWRALRYE